MALFLPLVTTNGPANAETPNVTVCSCVGQVKPLFKQEDTVEVRKRKPLLAQVGCFAKMPPTPAIGRGGAPWRQSPRSGVARLAVPERRDPGHPKRIVGFLRRGRAPRLQAGAVRGKRRSPGPRYRAGRDAQTH